MEKLKRFLKEEEGQDAIEYGILTALIALAFITGAGLLGDGLDAMFTRITNYLNANLGDVPAGE